MDIYIYNLDVLDSFSRSKESLKSAELCRPVLNASWDEHLQFLFQLVQF